MQIQPNQKIIKNESQYVKFKPEAKTPVFPFILNNLNPIISQSFNLGPFK